MNQLNPYLHFGGNCRDALTFYRDCLGGELEIMSVGDSPVADKMAPDVQSDVLHACLTSGALTLMASDTRGIEGVCGEFEGATPSSHVSLMLSCHNNAQIADLFGKLSDGGNVTCALGPQFWGATFGSLTDKFGINWLLECSAKPNALDVKAQGERAIVMTRVFDAPRQAVWNALSQPELLKRWWGLRADEMTTCEMNFRVGGAYRFVVNGPQGQHGFRGEFCEIVPNERLVQTFEWEGMPGHISRETLTLDEQGGQTTLTIHCLFDAAQDRDGMLNSGMAGGAGESYDRLEALLREQS